MKTIKDSAVLISIIILSAIISCTQNSKTDSLSDQEIVQQIIENSPLHGAIIPADIKERLGATHVGGKYYFTNEPYIIEGCKKLSNMGYGIVKLWFKKELGEYPYYPYNSDWNISEDMTLKELAQHPYYAACFDMPFSTIALSVGGEGINTTDESAVKEENEIYELTKYLLKKYKERNITFIIHNWEGDWIMRSGSLSNRWSRKANQVVDAVDGNKLTILVPSDSTQRINTMIKWFSARQNGVNRARSEVIGGKCKVYHAIEVNKVLDCMDGIPGVANYVLPNVETDMVSWSAYDGLTSDGLSLYKGIKYLQQNMKPTEIMKGKRIVFLGEIGIPEQRWEGLMDYEPVVKNWDTYIAVCIALDIPYIFQWELYCNEPKNEALRPLTETRTTEEMRGAWLIRPDGSKSFVADYFDTLLKNAGRRLP